MLLKFHVKHFLAYFVASVLLDSISPKRITLLWQQVAKYRIAALQNDVFLIPHSSFHINYVYYSWRLL